MREYQLYINGEFCDAADGRTFESLNPHDQSVVARCALAGPKDAARALECARAAFPEWSQTKPKARARALREMAALIKKNMGALAPIEAQDSGSVMRKAMGDMGQCAATFNYYADRAENFGWVRPLPLIESPAMAQIYVVKEPVGVCSQIIPWNFPLVMLAWKLGPALAMGNTLVIKPAQETPCSAMEFAKLIHDAGLFPPGVVNIIAGDAEAGQELVTNPIADKVAFTGSTVVGKEIMKNAAADLKRVTLELGGKSANIVLEDADLDSAIDAALWATFFHAGQACESGTRLFLPDTLHDDVVSKLVEKTKKIRLGDPSQMTSDMGPLVSQRQLERVLGYIEKGKAEGATVATGGKRAEGEGLDKGFYVEPTIFTGVTNEMTIAREEIFGPVLSVLRYKDVEEAIELANQSSYGLGGAVWSRDTQAAWNVAKRIRTGTVWINEYHMLNVQAPFGGYKESGLGREFGDEGLEAYTETKTIYMDLVGKREKKVWYDMIARRG